MTFDEMKIVNEDEDGMGTDTDKDEEDEDEDEDEETGDMVGDADDGSM